MLLWLGKFHKLLFHYANDECKGAIKTITIDKKSCRFDVGGLLQPQSRDGVLAQDKLLYFAAGRQRIGPDELEVARDLLMTDLALTILAQLLLGKFFSLSEDHHSQLFFAKELVGHAHDLHVSDLGMANQKLLDFAWEDVLAAANDHIFETTNGVDVAVRVHRCQVTAV